MSGGEGGLQALAAEAEANAAPRKAAEVAPGVERHQADAVNKKENRSLYADRIKIYPRAVSGLFRQAKWIILAVTLGIYYLLPWVRWDRGPSGPDQAVLLDFPNRKFYFFFIEIWPQEVYYITGLLVIAALVLFLVTSLAGRVWCGYTCPQTVWTDLFIYVEKLVEGDRSARIRLDKEPWTARKIRLRVIKHGLWLLIAVATGGAFVFYFRDAPTLAWEFLTFQAPAIAYVFVGVFTFTTYLLGGLAREQVCIYMCPWPRIQGAMFDEHSLLVSYRESRGEPRGPVRKNQGFEGRGDCIDCKACVAVCPMGIDIRDGAQLECIQCALCIDACDEIMDKVKRPRGLIGYDTYHGLERARCGDTPIRPAFVRPRTIIYAVLIAAVGLFMLAALVTRGDLDLNVLRDRNPLFVPLSDGSIRNGYTLKVINKQHDTRALTVSVAGVDGAVAELQGDADLTFTADPDALASLRLFVHAPMQADSVTDMTITITDEAGVASSVQTTFRGP